MQSYGKRKINLICIPEKLSLSLTTPLKCNLDDIPTSFSQAQSLSDSKVEPGLQGQRTIIKCRMWQVEMRPRNISGLDKSSGGCYLKGWCT